MSAPPKFVAAGHAARRRARSAWREQRISSLFVHAARGSGDAAPRPDETGIVTERDVLRALAERGARCAGDAGRSASTSRPLADGSGRCLRLSRHRAHEPAQGPPSRRHRRGRPRRRRAVGARPAAAARRARRSRSATRSTRRDDVPGLARAWAKLPQRRGLRSLAEGVSGARHRGRDLARARRADAPGRGPGRAAHAGATATARRPVPTRSAVLGSAGRGESLLAMDQDNALVFAEGAPDGPEDRWFATLGDHVADILHEVGVPYCKGGVMAKNPHWRGSVATWRDAHRRLDQPLEPAGPAVGRHLLRHARRARRRARSRARCWRDAFDAAARRSRLSPSCWPRPPAAVEPGLSFFGGFRTERGPHRPEEDRAVRHRHGRARARDPPSRRRALDAGAARRRQGARHRRAKATSTRWSRRRAMFLDLVLRAADRRHRARNAPVERRRGQATVVPRPRPAARGARSRQPSRRPDPRSSVQGLSVGRRIKSANFNFPSRTAMQIGRSGRR